ncbi:MAG: DHH family phosphoesterase, partial [archaeon]
MVSKKVSLKELILKCKKKSILLLTHENADLDAICSALMFQEFLKKNKIKSVIGVPHHINDRAQHFCFNEGISFQLNPNLNEFNLVVLFDVNGPEQLGRLRKSFEELKSCSCFELMVFDHHVLEKDSIVFGMNAFIDETCVSTTELLAKILGSKMSRRMHFLNCLGIIEDTGHFMTGDVDSFESFSSSLKFSNKNFADVLFYA